MFVTTPPSVIGQVKAEKIRALAYTGSKRHPSMPDVPTSAEAGLPSYNVESWFAVFAPAGTPPDIVNKLSTSIKKIVDSQEYRRKIEEQGGFAPIWTRGLSTSSRTCHLGKGKGWLDRESLKIAQCCG